MDCVLEFVLPIDFSVIELSTQVLEFLFCLLRILSHPFLSGGILLLQIAELDVEFLMFGLEFVKVSAFMGKFVPELGHESL